MLLSLASALFNLVISVSGYWHVACRTSLQCYSNHAFDMTALYLFLQLDHVTKSKLTAAVMQVRSTCKRHGLAQSVGSGKGISCFVFVCTQWLGKRFMVVLSISKWLLVSEPSCYTL